MSALVDRITEVMADSLRERFDDNGQPDLDEFAAHVAERVAEALSLTEIWHIPTTRCKDGQSRRPLNDFDSLHAAEKYREECLPEAQIYSQWVSEWTAVEPENQPEEKS